jgi:protein TonB
MTNSEILKSDFLDILFENRNKDYGAYALRREYSTRMLQALGTAMFLILGFVLFTLFKKPGASNHSLANNDSIIIRSFDIPKDPVLPEKPKETVKTIKKIASVKSVSVTIVPDKKADKDPLPTEDDKKDKIISTVTTDGDKDDGTLRNDKPIDNTGNGNGTPEPDKQPEFTADERMPEFPGGEHALQFFLANNLVTPEDLSEGERKMVRIRFRVEKDGYVNSFEIIASGGDSFDEEVIRVCKKMPRWKPAIQNKVNVAVSYVLPVTFVGA